MIVGPSWSDGSGEPGRPITDSGPIGLAGEAIRAAVVESRGHPRVLLTVENGLWAFWVPWDWEMFDPTPVAFDSMGLEVAPGGTPVAGVDALVSDGGVAVDRQMSGGG